MLGDLDSPVHKFSVDGINFVLDANSGVFFEIDNLAGDILELIEKGNNLEKIRQLLSEKYNPEIVDEAIQELEESSWKGFIFTEDGFSNYQPDKVHTINSLCMILSQDCNMACKYCYADAGSFGMENTLMSRETAEKSIEYLFNHSGDSRVLSVNFFGGEPLLNFDVLKHSIRYARKLASRYGKDVGFGMTTNGTLLTPEIRDYLVRNNVSLMISLDGPRDVNDSMRCFWDGSPSYDIVVGNLMSVLEGPLGDRCAVRGTFTRENINGLNKAVKHLAGLGCRDISVEPCFSRDELGIGEDDIESLKEEYTKLAKEYVRYAKNGQYLPYFTFENMSEQAENADLRVTSCGAGDNYLAVSSEGGLYPCHRLIGYEDYKLGDVTTNTYETEVSQLFKDLHVNNKEKCQSCWARYLCGGGCHAHALNFNDDISKPYDLDCKLQKHVIELGAYIHSEIKKGNLENKNIDV